MFYKRKRSNFVWNRFRTRFSFKQKLLFGITLSIFVVFCTGSVVSSWLIQKQLQEQARQQMEVTSQGIHAMVRSLVMSAIKNYLKGISETNLSYVEHVYAQFKSGKITEEQAKKLAEEFMLQQKIGSSGYVTAVQTDNNELKLAVHPHFKNRNLSMFPFAQQMARQKVGYLEFEWKNPDDSESRLKSEWMSFFKPWQWIINAAPYRDEYHQLVDLAGIETELAKVRMKGQGYAFIMDMHGTLLSHPTWKGRNFMNAVDFHDKIPFVRNMIESIKNARSQSIPEGYTGHVDFHLKDPQSDRVYNRMMNYRYVPEVDWIVGVITDVDKLEAPLMVVRNTHLAVMAITIVLVLLVVVWALQPVTRSISSLTDAVERIDGGNLGTHLPNLGEDEIGRLSSAFGRMAQRLACYTTNLELKVAERTVDLKKANHKLQILSSTDGLTGVANRRCFDQRLASEWEKAKRGGQTIAVIMLDVDFFKKYNDFYGHLAGDECLKNIAHILQTQAQDGGVLVARYGGEEFSVIWRNVTLPSLQRLAEILRTSVESLNIPHHTSPLRRVTISVGVALVSPSISSNKEDLLRASDNALYCAKSEGRNCVKVHHIQLDSRTLAQNRASKSYPEIHTPLPENLS